MSRQIEASKHRVYSPEEVDSSLHFIKLPKPIESSSNSGSSAPPTIEWWPCLVFANMMELNMITQQLDLWPSLTKHQIMMSYVQLLPVSATCRVALLMGERLPQGNSVIQFDITDDTATSETTSSFLIEPFYEKVLQFGVLYAHSEDYIKAVQQTLPVIQEVAKALHSSTGRNSTQDENCKVTDSNLVIYFNKEQNRVESPYTDVSLPKIDNAEIVSMDVVETPESNPTRFLEENKATAYNAIFQENEALITKAPMPPLSKVGLESPIVVKMYRSKTAIPVNKNVEFVDIPTFKDVKGTLNKGGYIFKPNFFGRPRIILKEKKGNSEVIMPSQRFGTAKALREDLCIHGVNCQCGTSMDEEKACRCWTDDEKWTIKLWVRYNVIRGPINVSSPVQVISSIHQATKYLIRIGYKRRQLESSLTTSEQLNELFRYLSQYGLPKEGDENAQCCDYTAISPEELFSLEYFISTNHFRVNTLYVEKSFRLYFHFRKIQIIVLFLTVHTLSPYSTYTLPTTAEPTPPTLTMDFDSPAPLSMVRPKRSVVLRQQRDDASAKKPKAINDEGGATIVSVESNISVVADLHPSKNEKKRKNTETPKKHVIAASTSQISQIARETQKYQTAESGRLGVPSYRSPIFCDNISSTEVDSPTTKRLSLQRVSLSPMILPVQFEEVLFPVYDGCDHDKLVSCLDALKPSNCANLPTICSLNGKTAKKSKFALNIRKVSHFVQTVRMSRGQNGTGKINEESSAVLYVCGAPGLGKSSGVNWCCNQVAKSTLKDEVKIKICHVNASYLTAQSTPLSSVMKDIAICMGIKAAHPSESTISKRLSDTKSSTVLIVVVDEIDALVTGGGRVTNGSDCLQTLLQWANNPTMQMGLIGISNCMNDNKFNDIRELGAVSAYC